MNERINKLFGQALDEAVPETWTTLDADQLNRLKEKFAELIVRECIDIVDTEEFGLMTQDRNYRIQTTKKIREHFGVES